MKEIKKAAELKKLLSSLKEKKKSIGFVPTMGALHEGHLSLIRKAKQENDLVVVSIFVNPTQFGPGEDFKKYPRSESRDKRLLKKEKVEFLFAPSVKEMYPKKKRNSKGQEIVSKKKSLMNGLCGKFRPGHFRGVAMIVAKLFSIVEPTRAYFGAKDYQQSVVIRKLISDLRLKIKLRVLPTIREPDGLALSSRNKYLSRQERADAREISRVLRWMKRQVLAGKISFKRVKQEGLKRLKRHVQRVQYLEIVDSLTLTPIKKRQSEVVLAVACYVGKTRLIDNVIIHSSRRPN